MLNVRDFCSSCDESVTLAVSFFDYTTQELLTEIILNEAQSGYKGLSVAFAYATIKKFYLNSAGVLSCSAYVMNA